MSDDRRDDTDSNETTGELRDNTIDFGDEFGEVKFADSDDSAPAISVDSTDTAQLPHWSEEPTGESPRFGVQPRDPSRPGTRDASRPTREPSRPASPPPVSRPAPEGRIRIGSDPTDQRARRTSDTHPTMRDRTGDISRPIPRDRTGDISRPILRDRTADPSRPTVRDRSPRRPAPVRPSQVRRARPDRGDTGTQPRPIGADRNLSSAVIVGLVLVVLFVGTSFVGPAAVMALVIVVLGIAALEFFSQTSNRGLGAPMVVGIVACVAAPLAAYYMSHLAIAMVVVFAFIAGAVSMVGSNDDQSGAITSLGTLMLGVVYIGLLGSYAGMILRMSTLSSALPNIGTDTLFIAVFAVAANDIGAYFVGSAIGRTPLKESISPNKTVEGLIGGTIATFCVVVILGLQSDTWNSLMEWIMLAAVVSIAAPIGDLLESVLKRSLGVKDFGTVLKGHGGVLDRFDGVLLSLPTVYFLAVTLTPWAS
ncbi:MAG: putative phosphatidate cytidylyltransferase [Actinomycetota bacterium]|jgi:phosphatidate cytidylyltransferase